MYDLYYMGTLLHHFSEKEVPAYRREIQHVFSGAHWEEVPNAPMRESVFVTDNDHKVLFTLVKD